MRRVSPWSIAAVCHEANRMWCDLNGDDSQPDWDDAPEWQMESALSGVKFALGDPEASPDSMHAAWSASKRSDGWTFGPVKDAEAKTHPCLIEWADLPDFQRRKDMLFLAIVRALGAT